MGLNYGGLFEDWEVGLAKGVVSDFQAQHPWLKTLEFDDLLQECLSHWHSSRSRFRPDRGASIKTYMRRVLNNRLHSLLRVELSARRRIQQVTTSLEESLDEEGTTLDDIASDLRDVAVRLDVASVVEELTPLQRQICELLAEELSPTRIARVLGKPRRTVRQEIGRIRLTFLKRGFGK